MRKLTVEERLGRLEKRQLDIIETMLAVFTHHDKRQYEDYMSLFLSIQVLEGMEILNVKTLLTSLTILANYPESKVLDMIKEYEQTRKNFIERLIKAKESYEKEITEQKNNESP